MALPTTRRRSGGARPSQQQWLATPQRWGPFRELEELQQATSQLLENVMGPGGSGAGVAPWVPAADIHETEDAWIIMAELPGVSGDDIVVEVDDNELTISGEIKEREREGILRRRTRRVGAFELRVTLPGQINADAMEATLDDGILTVMVPKPEQARPHRIQVQSGPGQSAQGTASGDQMPGGDGAPSDAPAASGGQTGTPQQAGATEG